MRLSDPTYFKYFRDRVFEMIDSGVRGFKFDGIAAGSLYITGANPNLLADYEALFDLVTQMRAHEKDVWVNATVGTWGSPYWFWYVDSIYRDGNDAGQAGQGNSQEKYVTYRDGQVHQNMIVENPLVPLNSVMNHGVILSDRTDGQIPNQPHDFSNEAVREAFGNDLKNFFSMGIGLQELYLRNTFFDPAVIGEENADWAWDTIALNARWARDNVDLLTDAHWVGGDPRAGDIYGSAAWAKPDSAQPAKAMIALRNPSSRPAYISLDVPKALELPAGEVQRYEFAERDGKAAQWVSDTEAPTILKVDPFQVVLFEGVPTDKEPTPSEKPDPSLLEIPRADWSVTASSEQTTGSELDPVSNLFDGDTSTIWHTRWNPTVDQYPHTVTVDMGRVNEVHRIAYLPRQNQNVTNGDIRGYKLEVSTDGSNWKTVVDAGEFSGDKSEQSIDIPEAMRSFRYFKLTATSSQNGKQFAGGAELRAFGIEGKSEWLDRTQRECTASDFEQTGEQGGQSGHPEHACDGKISTQWHSQYNPEILPMPHWLQADMRSMTDVSAFKYTPRQDAYPANGIIAKYSFKYSTDGETWNEAVSGEFADATPAVVELPEVVRASYVRLEAISAQNGKPFAGVAELDVKGELATVTPTAPQFIDEDGAEPAGYVIPELEGVVYLINGNAVAPGKHELAPGQTSVQISAGTAQGWTLADGNWMWSHTFESGEEKPDVTDPEPTASQTEQPEPTQTPSETQTDKPTVKPSEPTETQTDRPTVKPSEPTETQTDKPTVKPTETPTDKPTVEPSEPGELTVVTPEAPSFINPSASDPASCTVKPYATVKSMEGVVYTVTVDGKELTANAGGKFVYPYGKTIKVAAAPAEGFKFSEGAQTEWSWTAMLNDKCDSQPTTTPTTAPGQPTTAPAQPGKPGVLAKTGVEIAAVVALSLGLGVLGVGAVMLRRRRDI